MSNLRYLNAAGRPCCVTSDPAHLCPRCRARYNRGEPPDADPAPGRPAAAAGGTTYQELDGSTRLVCCGAPPDGCTCRTRRAELSDVEIRRQLSGLLRDTVPGFADLIEIRPGAATFTTRTTDRRRMWSVPIAIDHAANEVTLTGAPVEVAEQTTIQPVGTSTARRATPTVTTEKGNPPMALSATTRAAMIRAVANYTGRTEADISKMSARELVKAVETAIVTAAKAGAPAPAATATGANPAAAAPAGAGDYTPRPVRGATTRAVQIRAARDAGNLALAEELRRSYTRDRAVSDRLAEAKLEARESEHAAGAAVRPTARALQARTERLARRREGK